MTEERTPVVMSSKAKASNPGRLEVQWPVYARCFPRQPLTLAAWLLLPVLLTCVGEWFGGLLVLLGLACCFRRIRRRMLGIQEHFWFGCVNPAVVVSHDPDLIAVYTNLTTGKIGYLVVKVLPHPLKRMTGSRPAVGTRLAAVATYWGYVTRPHWDDFKPIAVNCVTADTAQIQRTLASLDPEEWPEMERALRQVPTPYRPGLYPVQAQTDPAAN